VKVVSLTEEIGEVLPRSRAKNDEAERKSNKPEQNYTRAERNCNETKQKAINPSEPYLDDAY